MTAIFTVWNSRISPVFDVASKGIVISGKSDIDDITEIDLPQGSAIEKVLFLKSMGVDEIICGAITCQAESTAYANGITVHSFVSGDINEVLAAWVSNELDDTSFSMPGCRRNPNGRGQGRGFGRKNNCSGPRGQGRGPNQGQGRGMGRGPGCRFNN